MTEAEAETPAGAEETGPAGPGSPDLAELLAGALAQLREMAAAVARLADIQAERARLAARKVIGLALLALWLSVVLVSATVLAVSHLLSGLAALLTGLFDGRAGLAELATGGIVLALILTAGLAVRTWIARANLRRLRRKYEPKEGSA